MRTDLAVLFDLDSTLVDSREAVRSSWLQLADEAGFDPRLLRDMHGIPAEGCLRLLLPEAGEDEIAAWTARIEQIEVGAMEGIAPIDGALHVVDGLGQRGIPWAIVTSCTRPLADARIAAAGLPDPHALVTFSDVANGKPHPEPFELGAARIGVPAGQCWVIEDAHSGVTAGKAAGCIVAGVLTTHSREQLPHADHILEHLGDLLALLDLHDGVTAR